MRQIHDINTRMQQFISMIDLHIADSIMSKDQEITDMNRGQMLLSVDSENKPLIHTATGSALLSPDYAKRTHKSKPNLFLSWDFQRNMFLNVNENDQAYFLTSDDEKAGFLRKNYGDKIFGIYDKDKAKQLTGAAFKRLFNQKVLLK